MESHLSCMAPQGNVSVDGPVPPHTVIFGCGNVLFGDDGFGPAVVQRLLVTGVASTGVRVEDVGTGIRDILFDFILCEEIRPKRIIVVDAVDHPGRRPGEVFEIDPASVPAKKIHDFSLHQFPTVNMLTELSEATDIEVRVIAVQIQRIPEEVSPGLSRPVAEAVSKAVERIKGIICQDKI